MYFQAPLNQSYWAMKSSSAFFPQAEYLRLRQAQSWAHSHTWQMPLGIKVATGIHLPGKGKARLFSFWDLNPLELSVLTILLCLFFSFLFWPHHVACGILVPWPETEPRSSAMRGQNPNHWITREFPLMPFLKHKVFEICFFLVVIAGVVVFPLHFIKPRNRNLLP